MPNDIYQFTLVTDADIPDIRNAVTIFLNQPGDETDIQREKTKSPLEEAVSFNVGGFKILVGDEEKRYTDTFSRATRLSSPQSVWTLSIPADQEPIYRKRTANVAKCLEKLGYKVHFFAQYHPDPESDGGTPTILPPVTLLRSV